MAVKQENIIRRQTIKKTNNRHSGVDHWHHRSEIVMVLEGQYHIRIGNQEQLCGPGDLAVIRSGQIHALRNGPGCCILVCTFDPTILYSILPEPRFPQSFITARELAAAQLTGVVSGMLEEIFQEQLQQLPLFEARMLTHIIGLYTLLVRYFGVETVLRRQALIHLKLFQSALEFIEAHYRENISLSHVANAINYNPTYFSSLFTEYAGINFKAYLDRYRIKKAVDMLRDTDLTVSEIAAQTGYDNIRTFNGAFRRITGSSPRELRKTFY